jgi:hypothetical protein
MPFTKACCFNKKNGTIDQLFIWIKRLSIQRTVKIYRKWFYPKDWSFWKETGIDLRVALDALHQDAKCHGVSWTKLVYSLVFPLLLLWYSFFFSALQSYINRYNNCNYRVMWTFDFLDYSIFKSRYLLLLYPHLVIVIGIPNCIFLTNKYQQEYVAHGNKNPGVTAS